MDGVPDHPIKIYQTAMVAMVAISEFYGSFSGIPLNSIDRKSHLFFIVGELSLVIAYTIAIHYRR